MTTRSISCPFCIHLNREIRDRAVCSAFPEGIPDDIKFGLNYHTEPYPGDNGIRFQAREGFEYLTEEFEDLDNLSRERGPANEVVT